MRTHVPIPAEPPDGGAARHAVAWLLAGNLAGLWLAASLVWPRLGDLAAPFTYGRWMPLHLNGQLYGWSALPLAGMLLRWYWPDPAASPWPRRAVDAWSAALAFGCGAWLMGGGSGKLFMDWAGPARVLFPAALATLALTLAAGWVRHRGAWTPGGRAARLALLAALAPVAPLMAWAADPGLYPPVNPDSGGATGSSLLGSTLVLVAVYWWAPVLWGAVRVRDAGRVERAGPLLLAVHFALLAALGHGDVSHHQPAQVAGLFSLWAWPPLLLVRVNAFAWSPAARRWLLAFGAWGALLTVTACIMFLPGALERGKFTNTLVAHTHLAMAGMVSSFGALVLVRINARAEQVFARRAPFWGWQAATLLHVAATFAVGQGEARDPALLFHPGSSLPALGYALRLVAGLLAVAASLAWCRGLCRVTPSGVAP